MTPFVVGQKSNTLIILCSRYTYRSPYFPGCDFDSRHLHQL